MYPKTVRFRFIIVAAVWRVFWLRKEHYDISMQMGRILYFQKEVPTTLLQQQVPVAIKFFDGTNRNAEHPVTILVPNELML
jgi:hypothetical protein